MKLDQENDAAMEDWFVTTSQIHVFDIYFMGLTTEVQLKWKSCDFKRSCVPPMRGIIIHGTILNTLNIQNTFYKTNSVVVGLVLAV